MPDAKTRSVGSAVEEALLPLRLQSVHLGPSGLLSPLQQVDAALAPLHLEQGYSRCTIRRYLRANVFFCIADGLFCATRNELVQHLREGARLPRNSVKRYKYAKLFLVKL